MKREVGEAISKVCKLERITIIEEWLTEDDFYA